MAVKPVNPARYIRNVTKSAGYITVDVARKINPELVGFLDDSKETIKDMFYDITHIGSTIKDTIKKSIGEENIEELKKTKGYILEDLVSGKLYNPERQNDAMKEFMGIDDDMFSFDFDMDDDEAPKKKKKKKDKSEDEGSSDEVTTTSNAERVMNTISGATATGAAAIINNSNANARIAMSNSVKANGKINAYLGTIQNTIMYSYQEMIKPINIHVENSSRFYQVATEEMAKQSYYLEVIANLLNDRFAPVNEYNVKEQKEHPWDSIVGYGMPSLSSLKDTIVGKLKNDIALDMISGIVDPEMIQSVLETGALKSPISAALSMLLSNKLQNSPLGKELDKTTEIITNGFTKLAFGIHKANLKRKGNGALGFLANLFDIVPRESTTIRGFEQYNKGRADWTGKDDKALREVIPTYLAEILASITGKEAKIFDYDTGRFQSASSLLRDFRAERYRAIGRADSSAKDKLIKNFIERDKKANPKEIHYTYNSKKIRDMSEDYDTIMGSLAIRNVDISQFKTKEEFINYCADPKNNIIKLLKDPDSLQDIANEMFKSNGAIETIQRTQISNRHAFAKFQSTVGLTNYGQLLNGSGLLKAGGSNDNSIAKMFNVTKDNTGRNVFSYLQDYYNRLRDIIKIIARRGGNSGNRTNKHNHYPPSNVDIPNDYIAADTITEDEYYSDYNDFKRRIALKGKSVSLASERAYEEWLESGLTLDKWLENELSRNDTPDESTLTPKQKEDKDKEGRYVYNTHTKKYEEVDENSKSIFEKIFGEKEKDEDYLENKVRPSNRAKKKKELEGEDPEGGPIARAARSINEFLSDVFYGTKLSDFMKDVKKANGYSEDYSLGLVETIQTIPTIISEGSHRIWNKIKDKWNEKYKDGFIEFYQNKFNKFKENVKLDTEWYKGKIKNFFKKDKNEENSTDNTNTETETNNPPTLSKGTESVDKTGLAILSKGELVVPRKNNPFYNGSDKYESDESLQKKENSVLDKISSKLNDIPYFGNFAKGGTVDDGAKLNRSDKKLLKRLIDDMVKSGASESKFVKAFGEEKGKELYESLMNGKEKLNKDEMNTLIRLADDMIKSGASKEDFIKAFGEEQGKDLYKSSLRAQKFNDVSDKVLKHLFGDEEKYQNSKQFTEFLTKTARASVGETIGSSIFGGAIGGAITGSGLGVFAGMVLGAGSYLVNNSESLTELLFGEMGKDGEWTGGKLPKSVANFIKGQLPRAGRKGLLGGIIGGALTGTPGGIVGGMILGAGLNLVSGTETFKDVMFGHEDVNGERNGGIVGTIKTHVVDPIIKYTENGFDKISKFFKEEIFSPLKRFFHPFKDRLLGRVNKFLTNFGKSIITNVKKTLSDRFATLFNPVTSVVGKVLKTGINVGKKVVSAPFKALGKIGDRMEYGNIRKGFSSLTPEERLQYAEEFKDNHRVSKRKEIKYNEYNEWATRRENESDEDYRTRIGDMYSFLNGRSWNEKVRTGIRQNMYQTVQASLIDGGTADPSISKKLRRLLNSDEVVKDNDFTEVKKYINKLSSDQITDEKKSAVLDYIDKMKSEKLDASFKEDEERKGRQTDFYEQLLGDKLEGLDPDSKEYKRIIKKFRKSAVSQSYIDTKNILGKKIEENDKETEEAINAQKAADLLKEQEKESPIDKKRNEFLENILKNVYEIKCKVLGVKYEEKESGIDASMMSDEDLEAMEEAIDAKPLSKAKKILNDSKKNPTTVPNPVNIIKQVETSGSGDILGDEELENIESELDSRLNRLFHRNKKEKSNVPNPNDLGKKDKSVIIDADYEPVDEKKSPDKIDTNDEGDIIEYRKVNGELEPDITDASTKEAITKAKNDRKLRNAFYTAFIGAKNGLIDKFKQFFDPENKESGKKGLGIFSKIKSWISGIGDKLFGENSILGKIYTALGGVGGLGSILTTVLPAILIGALSIKTAENTAGTIRDAGVRKGTDLEERKEEVSKYGVLRKLNLGFRNMENIVRKRDMTSYNEDDFVSEYAVDRTKKRVLLKNVAGALNPDIGKANKAVLNKLTPKHMREGINNIKDTVSARKLLKGSADARLDLLSPERQERILNAAIKKENTINKIKNSRLTKSIANSKAFKSVSSATTGLFSKVKDKIGKVISIVGEKFGITDTKSLSGIAEELTVKIVSKITGKSAEEATKLIPVIGWVIYAADIAAAVAKGAQKAECKTILGIIDDPTPGQKILAATLNGINAAIPLIGGIIPTETLLNILIKVFNIFGLHFDGLEEQRAYAKQTVAVYNQENGTTYNIEEYIHNVQGQYTFGQKLVKNIKGIFKKSEKEEEQDEFDEVYGIGGDEDLTNSQKRKLKRQNNKLERLNKRDDRKAKRTTEKRAERKTKKDIINEGLGDNSSNKKKNKNGYLLEAFNSIKDMNNRIKTEFNKGSDSDMSFFDIVKIDPQISEDNPLKGFVKGVATVSKFITVPKVLLGGVLSFIGLKLFGPLIDKTRALIGDTKNVIKEDISFAKEGKLKELWKNKVEISDDNPISLVTRFVNIGSKLILTPIAAVAGLTNTFKNFITNIKEMSDISGMAKEIWEYRNPEKKLPKFKSIIDKYKVKDGGFAGGIVNTATSLVGRVVQIATVVVRPFVWISNKITKVVDTISNVFTKITGFITNIKDSITNVFTKIKEFIDNFSLGNLIDEGLTNLWQKIFDKKKDEEDEHGLNGSGSGLHVTQKGNYSRFGSSTIDDSGCGPAAASTILRYYGKNVDINDSASYAEKNGYVAGKSSVGTKSNFFKDIFGKFGIGTSYSENKSDINKSISNNKPTILLGEDKNNNSKENSPFGSNPHYVVAKGKDRNGNIIVDDPELNGTALYKKNILNNTNLGISTDKGIGGKSKTTNTDSDATQDTSSVQGILDTFFNSTISKVITAGSLGSASGKLLSMIFGLPTTSTSDGSNASNLNTSNNNTNYPVSSYNEEQPSGYTDYGKSPVKILRSVPPKSDPYINLYNNKNNGGISWCVNGTNTGSHHSTHNVLANCVGWACARFNHIYNLLTGETGIKFPEFCCNAENFIEVAIKYGLKIGQTPQVGAIMVWQKGQYGDSSDGAGHVAIVERVDSNDKVFTSESAWNSTEFYNKTRERGSDGNWGQTGTYRFRAFIYNPAVEGYSGTSKAKTDKFKDSHSVMASGSEITKYTGITRNDYKAGDSGILRSFDSKNNTKKAHIDYDFTKPKRDTNKVIRSKVSNAFGGKSMIEEKANVASNIKPSKNNQSVSEIGISALGKKIDQLAVYLKQVAKNTGYNSSIPEIISILKDNLTILSNIISTNGNSALTESAKADAANEMNNEINLMMDKLNAIASSL